jgi:hypothetical protein
MTTPHRIRTQRWMVKTATSDEAFAWRSFLRAQGAEMLQPLFDQVFDEVADDSLIIRIPRLELQLRADSPEQLQEKLPGEIREQLRDLMPEEAGGQETVRAENPSVMPFMQQERELQSEKPKTVSSSEKHLSGQEMDSSRADFAALLHYLRSGLAPWQHAASTSASEATSFTAICRCQLPWVREYLARSKVGSVFYFRLLQLAAADKDNPFLAEIMATLTHRLQGEAAQCAASLLGPDGTQLSQHSRLHLLAAILAESQRGQETRALPEIFAICADALPPTERLLFEEFAARFSKQVMPRSSVPSQDEALNKAQVRKTERFELTAPLAAEDSAVVAPHSATQTQPEEELYPLLVQHSGMILLHPFLPKLLENVGITDPASRRLNGFALPRAAAILHFLATGHEEIFEYELGFIKIMLGLQPTTALPAGEGLLTQSDREEAETVLQAAISHWQALKNTSIKGLRSSFLLRQGLVREVENGWRLSVERRPFDMLLDQLPWGIGIVKLPWMSRAIFTEW